MLRFIGWIGTFTLALMVLVITGAQVFVLVDLPEYARERSSPLSFPAFNAKIEIIANSEREGRREVVLIEPWGFEHAVIDENNHPTSEYILVPVPARFKSDFASIPIWGQWFISPFGKHAEAAIVHDWIYAVGKIDRREADAIFYIALKRSGVDPIRRAIMYAAVRIGGGDHFGKSEDWNKTFYDPAIEELLPHSCILEKPETPYYRWPAVISYTSKQTVTTPNAGLNLYDLGTHNTVFRGLNGRFPAFVDSWERKLASPECADFLISVFMKKYEPFYNRSLQTMFYKQPAGVSISELTRIAAKELIDGSRSQSERILFDRICRHTATALSEHDTLFVDLANSPAPWYCLRYSDIGRTLFDNESWIY